MPSLLEAAKCKLHAAVTKITEGGGWRNKWVPRKLYLDRQVICIYNLHLYINIGGYGLPAGLIVRSMEGNCRQKTMYLDFILTFFILDFWLVGRVHESVLVSFLFLLIFFLFIFIRVFHVITL